MRRGGGHGGGGGHDGAGGLRWLLTYADLITLLLAFFIILFSISTMDKNKYKALARAMSGKVTADSSETTKFDKNNPHPKTKKELEKFKRIFSTQLQLQTIDAQLKEYIRRHHITSTATTHIDPRGLVISLLTDKALYESGSAELRPDVKQLIDEVYGFIALTENEIRVEGNTDNVPIRTSQYPSNWELSAARATTVTRYLVEQKGLKPIRISAAGYGEYNPITDNQTPQHRATNRRVDIVILNDKVSTEDLAR
jgi:chemotaxis protein MotB